MNLLRFNSIVKLSDGQTSLEVLAMNHDPELYSIVQKLVSFPSHTNFATSEFVEGVAGLLTVYLSEYPERRKAQNKEEKLPLVLSVILACLLKLRQINLNPTVNELPVADALFNKCMEMEAAVVIQEVETIPEELQPVVEPTSTPQIPVVNEELLLRAAGLDSLFNLQSAIDARNLIVNNITGNYTQRIPGFPSEFLKTLEKFNSDVNRTTTEWYTLAAGYYQVSRALFPHCSYETFLRMVSDVPVQMNVETEKNRVITYISSLLVEWTTVENPEDFKQILLHDLKLILLVLRHFRPKNSKDLPFILIYV